MSGGIQNDGGAGDKQEWLAGALWDAPKERIRVHHAVHAAVTECRVLPLHFQIQRKRSFICVQKISIKEDLLLKAFDALKDREHLKGP